jgi:septation ring formation regulator EzrA
MVCIVGLLGFIDSYLFGRDAWKALTGMSKEEAKEKYIATVIQHLRKQESNPQVRTYILRLSGELTRDASGQLRYIQNNGESSSQSIRPDASATRATTGASTVPENTAVSSELQAQLRNVEGASRQLSSLEAELAAARERISRLSSGISEQDRLNRMANAHSRAWLKVNTDTEQTICSLVTHICVYRH